MISIAFLENILSFFKNRKLKKEARKATLIRVTENYESLINEFRLIQEKKSRLSRSQRDDVVLGIKHLIEIGHIKVHN